MMSYDVVFFELLMSACLSVCVCVGVCVCACLCAAQLQLEKDDGDKPIGSGAAHGRGNSAL